MSDGGASEGGAKARCASRHLPLLRPSRINSTPTRARRSPRSPRWRGQSRVDVLGRSRTAAQAQSPPTRSDVPACLRLASLSIITPTKSWACTSCIQHPHPSWHPFSASPRGPNPVLQCFKNPPLICQIHSRFVFPSPSSLPHPLPPPPPPAACILGSSAFSLVFPSARVEFTRVVEFQQTEADFPRSVRG